MREDPPVEWQTVDVTRVQDLAQRRACGVDQGVIRGHLNSLRRDAQRQGYIYARDAVDGDDIPAGNSGAKSRSADLDLIGTGREQVGDVLPAIVRDVLVGDSGVLAGNADLSAGDYGPRSILNGALETTANALPKAHCSKEEQASDTCQNSAKRCWRQPIAAEFEVKILLRLHTASVDRYLELRSVTADWRLRVSAYLGIH